MKCPFCNNKDEDRFVVVFAERMQDYYRLCCQACGATFGHLSTTVILAHKMSRNKQKKELMKQWQSIVVGELIKTDLQRFIDLYASIGINLKPIPDDPGEGQYLTIGPDESDQVCDPVSGTIIGYDGFHARIDFDENGKFISFGVWE